MKIIQHIRDVLTFSSFRHPDILDAAIHLVIRERGLSAPLKDLTEQDLFFREVWMP